ncbi:hypothetical protein [Pseudanabaena sp. ABRG5-3]|nr:hypothetical protein [Pseudanabaena sp. ABRG5-3]
MWVMRGRSLVDVGNRRSGLWMMSVRSLFDVEIVGDRVVSGAIAC